MKRFFLLALLLVCCISLFSAKLVKVEPVDEFGDPTGDSYLTFDEDLSGTYKNVKGNGNLKWNVVIEKKGYLSFIVKEDGDNKDVTIASSSVYYVDKKCKFKITFKLADNSKSTEIAYITKSDTYKFNEICIGGSAYFAGVLSEPSKISIKEFLASNRVLKVAISTDYGTYSLGTMNMEGAEEYLFDKELYNKGVMLMEEGKYSDALDVFVKYRESDVVSYSHYDTPSKEAECSSKVGKYNVGGKGPAGGYIFYDCDADNNSGNEDGLISSECGWRYLEAAPTDLSEKYSFGFYRPNGTSYNLVGTKKAVGTGEDNTLALVSAMGDKTYITDSGYRGPYAAFECYNYSIEVGGITYDDWFLPSEDELALMCSNLHKKGLGNFERIDNNYWSSTESSVSRAQSQNFTYQGHNTEYRDYDYHVRPIRAFM